MTPAAVRVVAATGRGRVRPVNQDAVLFDGWLSQAAAGHPVELRAAWRPPVVCAVADGLGGHPAGDLASRLALGEVAERSDGWTGPEAVRSGLVGINEALFAAAGRGQFTVGMGTTIAGVVLTSAGALCFNVGDSRVYRVRAGDLEQLSTDDALLDVDGSPNGVVTQALGSAEPVRPHVREVPLRGAARFLVCTDGLSGPVAGARLRGLCREPDALELAGSLLRAADAAGAPDNVTLAVVDVLSTEPRHGAPPGVRRSVRRRS